MTGQKFIFHIRKTENKHLRWRLYITEYLELKITSITAVVQINGTRELCGDEEPVLYPECGGGGSGN